MVSAVNTLVLFFAPVVLIFGLCTRTGCALVLIFGSSCANVWPKLKPWKPFYLIFFVCRCKIRINGLFGKNSRLWCFVANFIADGFTRFLCYFWGKKCACANFYTFRMSGYPFDANCTGFHFYSGLNIET